MNFKNSKYLVAIGAGLLILLLVFSNSIFFRIGNGERGVMYKLFSGGLDTVKIYDEGFHVKAPWNTIYKFDVKIQQLEESINAIASDGLNMTIDFSIRFNPIRNQIGNLKNKYSGDYIGTIIIPQVRSVTRQVIAKYKPEEVYSTKRQLIQEEIENITREGLEVRYVSLDALLIRNVQLPKKIENAIEDKLSEQQALEKDQFRLSRESLEAQRRIIEAEGIKKADSIVSKYISRSILQLRGIEATRELANSPNSKVVIIGSGKDGLPIILGDR